MRRHPDRELAFQVLMRMTRGVLRLGEREVGQVTGQIVVPIRAFYRAHPRPGQYLVNTPHRGQLVPSGASEDIPTEVIVETMGNLDVAALLAELDMPLPGQSSLRNCSQTCSFDRPGPTLDSMRPPGLVRVDSAGRPG